MSIQPVLMIEKHVQMDFIPLVKNPRDEVSLLSEAFKLTNGKFQRKLVKDMYITRIRVCPLDSTKIFFIKEEEEDTLECYVREKNKTKRVKGN